MKAIDEPMKSKAMLKKICEKEVSYSDLKG
jgi:hypothetical protein